MRSENYQKPGDEKHEARRMWKCAPVALVLRVPLPPRGSVGHHGVAHVILHEVQGRGLQGGAVTQQDPGRVVASLVPQQLGAHGRHRLEFRLGRLSGRGLCFGQGPDLPQCDLLFVWLILI